MFVRDTGTGPAVLFLHDAPSSPYDFKPLVERLGSGTRALVPDMPGYGQTPPEDGYSWQRSISVIEEALTDRGISTLKGIVGVGAGAHRALAIALGGRVQVEAVVSLGGFANLDASTRSGLGVLGGMLRGLPHLNDPALQHFFVNRALSPQFAAAHADEVNRILGWLNETRPFALGTEFEALSRCEDLLPRLGSMRARLLARVGRLDNTAPVASSEAMVAAVPGAELQIVEGHGHALLLEERDATIDSVARFLV